MPLPWKGNFITAPAQWLDLQGQGLVFLSFQPLHLNIQVMDSRFPNVRWAARAVLKGGNPSAQPSELLFECEAVSVSMRESKTHPFRLIRLSKRGEQTQTLAQAPAELEAFYDRSPVLNSMEVSLRTCEITPFEVIRTVEPGGELRLSIGKTDFLSIHSRQYAEVVRELPIGEESELGSIPERFSSLEGKLVLHPNSALLGVPQAQWLVGLYEFESGVKSPSDFKVTLRPVPQPDLEFPTLQRKGPFSPRYRYEWESLTPKTVEWIQGETRHSGVFGDGVARFSSAPQDGEFEMELGYELESGWVLRQTLTFTVQDTVMTVSDYHTAKTLVRYEAVAPSPVVPEPTGENNPPQNIPADDQPPQ